MGTEVVPVVDLGALSQSELVALAAASPYAVDPRLGRRDADLLPPPKIDRAVFNESAGSRKQTFSRRRVATNPSHSLTPSTASSSAAPTPTQEDSEKRLIVFHLQQLFARDDPSYLPPPPPIPLQQQTLTLPAIPAPTPTIPVPAPPSTIPVPAPPVASVPIPQLPDPDRELTNPKGVAVDLARLAELVDPYGEEICNRTAGLALESELLGFMNELEGQWGSRRRRRKFVDAAIFGDHLPRGWKLILGIKRKERAAWINCRRYVSPRGHQFATCREVSSYFMSLLGYVEAKATTVQNNNVGVHDLSAVNSAGLHQQNDSVEEMQSAVPTSVTLSIDNGDSQGQKQKPYKDEAPIEAVRKECKKCNLTFEDQNAYVQHQLSFHQRKAKRRKVDKSIDLGVGKDGKLETQESQRTSEDKPGCFGHGVADVKSQGQSPAELFGGASSGDVGAHLSLAAAPCGLQEITGLPEQEEEPSAGEPVSGQQKDLAQENTGLPQPEKELSATEPFVGHQKEHVDNSGDNESHDGACHIAKKTLAFDVARNLSSCKSPEPEVHEHDSSKDLEFSIADFSGSFDRPQEISKTPQDVPCTTDAPGESKCTDDPMDCADITLSKQVSEHCDMLDRKFSGFPGETGFNDQVENNPLSANLDEPDLSSISMEVDHSKIACKFGNVLNPTSSEYDKPAEDQIDRGVTALKKDEINIDNGMNIDVRIKDVNLNSCLDTISSPVSGANCETSNALHDGSRSSILAHCFGASSNDDNVCQDEGFVNQNNVSKAEIFVNQSNDMVYQSNMNMNHISPPQISVDYFTSCSMNSEIKNNDNRRDDNSREQFVNSRNISSNETGFDAEAYNNDIFTGAIAESSFAHLNNAMNMKTDFSSCYSISDLNTLTGGTATDGIDFPGMRSSFVSGSTSCSEPNELDFDIKGSMLEALERSDSDLETQYDGGDPACDSLPPAGTSASVDDFMSMHANFGSLTSLVRSVEGGPMSRLIQDQCDLQLGFGAQKQQIYPSFEEHLRMASAGALQFGNMVRHNPVPVPEPTLMLGYEPTLMLGYAAQFGTCPPVQLGWDLSKMVGVLQSVCVWCNTRFQHFGTAEQQSDSVGFICPACKDKTSGHLSILNNGSSL